MIWPVIVGAARDSHRQTERSVNNPNFRFCKVDITDRDAVFGVFEEEHPDIVVNFAAESHVDRSIENPDVFLKTNILGTQVTAGYYYLHRSSSESERMYFP